MSSSHQPTRDIGRIRVSVGGVVQGVGFRPFVWRLARELGLSGWVGNDARGVRIEAEGPPDRLDALIERIRREYPPLARVERVQVEPATPLGEPGFEIRASAGGPLATLISPDLATCADCAREIFDPTDRRHRYPFTNCTNCGPRYSIIAAMPYDRAHTTMARFVMCDACRAEYENPADRRFHAQPIACPRCGPSLELRDAAGQSLARGDEALAQATAAVAEGRILALKGLGGFQLIVNAGDGEAVARLRRLKRREARPLAVMVPTLAAAAHFCRVSPLEARLLASPEGPIVLLCRHAGGWGEICEAVAPGVPELGLMLPTTPLHHLLLATLGFPVVATSGNRKDEPICIDEAEAAARLAGLADLFLVHDRPILRHVDDSVAQVAWGRVQLLRRARGYAPLPVFSYDEGPPARSRTILAVGAHQKSTIALASNGRVYLSQHMGDLETPEALTAFENTVTDLGRLLEARPEVVARDLHPDYLSSQYAERLGLPVATVQHHHAHALAAMAEHDLAGPVLAVVWDGTGLGTDGTSWGGEFLRVTRKEWRRLARLRRFPLPGGDAAVREPRRAAVGLLWALLGPAALERRELVPVAAFKPRELEIIGRALARGLQSPLTSSAGRLFDAVASIAGLRQHVSYEGQAAIELEAAAAPQADATPYPFAFHENGPTEPADMDWGPLIEALLADLKEGAPPGLVAARFHATLVEMLLELASRTGLMDVVLCGGCFQNRRLLEMAAARLEAAGHRPWWPQRVPTNDGGIALGQVAAQLWARGAIEAWAAKD